MTDLLRKLPAEVFLLVSEKLTKADLSRLSQTSRWLRQNGADQLWRSITIQPSSEDDLYDIEVDDLPQPFLHHGRHIHFRSEIRYLLFDRCPQHESCDLSVDHFYDEDYEDESQLQSPFDTFSQKAESVLRQIAAQQLWGFSWDLGTCIPPEILGKTGVLTLNQPSLRSLSLITDPSCLEDVSNSIDLSPFYNLQSLSWRGLHGNALDALSTALKNNSIHLRKLELDFVNWHAIRSYMDDFSDDDEDDVDRIKEPDYFTFAILGLNEDSNGPLFPEIRELSLSHIHLSKTLSPVFNFNTLMSLTLRMCIDWDRFFDSISQLHSPPKLKRLEIYDDVSLDGGLGDFVILNLLQTFNGLEEFFVCLAGPVATLELWDCIAQHHSTVRRLVCHQRIISTNEYSPRFEEPCDLGDLGMVPQDFLRIESDPSQNPLTKLDLEFIGLCCVPEYLYCILLPFTSTNSLKVLHVRQSSIDLKASTSWAINDGPVINSWRVNDGSSDGDESLQRSDSIPDSPISANEQAIHEASGADMTAEEISAWHPTLRDAFRLFAMWAFGHEGIPSLEIIAFGDFSYGGRMILNKIMLGRNTDGTGDFRFLEENNDEWRHTLDTYRGALEACPAEPLFRY